MESMNSLPKIRVVVRKRQSDTRDKDPDIVNIESNSTITVRELKQKVDLTKYIDEHRFTFDHVFGEDATNDDIYLT